MLGSVTDILLTDNWFCYRVFYCVLYECMFSVGGWVGDSEAGSVRVCRKLCWYLQRGQQEETVICYCYDWLSSSSSPGMFFLSVLSVIVQNKNIGVI